MREFYDTNEDFKGFVDRYCTKHKITVEEALTHEIVRLTYLFYKEVK